MSWLVQLMSWYFEVSIVLFIFNMAIARAQTSTMEEAIRAEAARCGLSEELSQQYPLWRAALYAISAWPTGLWRTLKNLLK